MRVNREMKVTLVSALFLFSTSETSPDPVDMEPTEELAVCGHCNKEVVKVNLPMHEAHCQRFLCLCPDCDEQVPKDQLEEHQKEQHAPVRCKKCNMKMEKCNLPDHEANECIERLEICEYCQLDLPLSALKEHIVACGSRTKRCQDCNQYVMMKDQLEHPQVCTQEDVSLQKTATPAKSITANVQPPFANTLQDDKTQLDDIMAFDRGDQRTPSQAANSGSGDATLSLSDFQKKKRNQKMVWGDDDQIRACPYCHLTLPVNTLQWHQDKCRIAEGLKRINEAKLQV